MGHHDPPTPPTSPPDPTSTAQAAKRLRDASRAIPRSTRRVLDALAVLTDYRRGEALFARETLAAQLGLNGDRRADHAAKLLRDAAAAGFVRIIDPGGGRGRGKRAAIVWAAVPLNENPAHSRGDCEPPNPAHPRGDAGAQTPRSGAQNPAPPRHKPRATARKTPRTGAPHHLHQDQSSPSPPPTPRPDDDHTPTPTDSARAVGGCGEDGTDGGGAPDADTLAERLRAEGVSPAQARALAADATPELVAAAIDLANEANARGELRNRGGLIAQQLRNPDSEARRRADDAKAAARSEDARRRESERQRADFAAWRDEAASVPIEHRTARLTEAREAIRNASASAEPHHTA